MSGNNSFMKKRLRLRKKRLRLRKDNRYLKSKMWFSLDYDLEARDNLLKEWFFEYHTDDPARRLYEDRLFTSSLPSSGPENDQILYFYEKDDPAQRIPFEASRFGTYVGWSNNLLVRFTE